jgi:hypothetical protein
MGKHFIDPKSSEFCPFFKFFLLQRKLPFFGQNCSLPFSLRSLDIPALLKSWKKHYVHSILSWSSSTTDRHCDFPYYIITEREKSWHHMPAMDVGFQCFNHIPQG